MRAGRQAIGLACACALALLACESSSGAADAGEPDAMPAPPEARLEIGQGETAYAPLADGETLPYEHGAQGGQHVYVSLRIFGLEPRRALLEARTEVEGEPELVLDRSGRLTFMPYTPRDTDAGPSSGEEPSLVYIGWPAQILGAVDHPGERAILKMQVTDVEGRTAADEKTIVIGEP